MFGLATLRGHLFAPAKDFEPWERGSMGKHQDHEETQTLRTVFLPVSLDSELSIVARQEGLEKQEVIRKAICNYITAVR